MHNKDMYEMKWKIPSLAPTTKWKRELASLRKSGDKDE